MVMFGHNHQDSYPLPSELDKGNATIASSLPGDEPDVTKDNTGNIYSVMVFNGLPPEILRTPAEVDESIEVAQNYEYYQPQRAATPAGALWDPGFAGVPLESGTGGGSQRRTASGNTSYATLTPFGSRRTMWNTTYSSNQAVVANRGPIWGGSPGHWLTVPGPFGAESLTLKIHGSDKTWEGNVGYNDGRVSFEQQPDPPALHWAFTALPAAQRNSYDNMFVNENDRTGVVEPDSKPARASNAFLKLYSNVRVENDELTISVWQD
jgi:hypothetical protein